MIAMDSAADFGTSSPKDEVSLFPNAAHLAFDQILDDAISPTVNKFV